MKIRWVVYALEIIAIAIILTLFLLPQETTSATIPILAPLNERDIKLIIIETAFRHEINVQKFLNTAKCETKFRNIQSEIVKNGVREESYGIFQIHLPAHPTVTKEKALDPYFASEWSAKKFKENPNIWACYRKLYNEKI